MTKLFRSLKKNKANIALVKDNVKYDYGYLLNFSLNIKKKIPKGSLILLIANNDVETISMYVSSIINGNYLIILDHRAQKSFITNTIKKFKPNFIFANTTLEGFDYKGVFSFMNYNLLITKNTHHKSINKKNSILLTTSGTTSNPKFVRLSNLNIFTNAYQILDYLKISSKSITITTLPFAYSYGLSIINTHLEKGAKIILNNDSVISPKFWEKIKIWKVNSFSGVPEIFEYLKKIKFDKYLTSSIRYMTVAGGKLNIETMKFILKICKDKSINFISMYGQTEASPRISYLDVFNNLKKIESIGRPVKNSKIKIYKGELVFIGKNVSLGYANNLKDLLKGDENKGKIFTGDLGYKDKDGYFYITGRKKRISKIFGLRVDLDDIEKYLSKKGFKVKITSDDKLIQISNFKSNQEDKIKDIINDEFKINKNFLILENSNKNNNSQFKKI